MGFYINLLLSPDNLSASLVRSIEVQNYEVGVVRVCLPKTFNNTIHYISLKSNIVVPQFFYDGQKLLTIMPVHNTDMSPLFIHEPSHVQYHAIPSSTIRDIVFALYDENDNPIDFANGKILVVLHFKNKN